LTYLGQLQKNVHYLGGQQYIFQRGGSSYLSFLGATAIFAPTLLRVSGKVLDHGVILDMVPRFLGWVLVKNTTAVHLGEGAHFLKWPMEVEYDFTVHMHVFNYIINL